MQHHAACISDPLGVSKRSQDPDCTGMLESARSKGRVLPRFLPNPLRRDVLLFPGGTSGD